MGHEAPPHEDRHKLSFFASPLAHIQPPDFNTHIDVEQHQNASPNTTEPSPTFKDTDSSLPDTPSYHHHTEASPAELFYDLFFVANLTTFTSMQEINDHASLTAYIGFFSLLWLTWYQSTLYDVQFSADCVFERIPKAIHFGVMVGFAVIGPQWKPGQEVADYKIYRAFGVILMVSRLALFGQYGVTLLYVKKYGKTVVPLGMVMASTLLAAVLYRALTSTFPRRFSMRRALRYRRGVTCTLFGMLSRSARLCLLSLCRVTGASHRSRGRTWSSA